jgi:hypothetical protein
MELVDQLEEDLREFFLPLGPGTAERLQQIQEHIQQIGRQLYRDGGGPLSGGLDLMRTVHKEIATRRGGRYATILEQLWRDIGFWSE